jgi:hypothetical protein
VTFIVQSGRLIWHAGRRHAAVTSQRIGKFLPNIKKSHLCLTPMNSSAKSHQRNDC